MIKYVLVFLASFVFTALVAYGMDERERRVKVALALQSDSKVVELAPAPTVVTFPTFSEGYVKAIKEEKVLVVYIGCDGQKHDISPINGCVVAKQAEMLPYGKGTILVAYPSGNKLLQHKALKCEENHNVVKEVQEALKKIDKRTEDTVVNKPLNWELVSTEDCCSYCGGNCTCPDKEKCKNNQCTVAKNKTEAKCDKCDKCDCKDDTCPNCKKKEEKVTDLPGYTFWYQDAAGNKYYIPNGNSPCANGKCPLK